MFEVADVLVQPGSNQPSPCRLFLIEAADGPGLLLRILGMLQMRQAVVRCVRAETSAGVAHIRLEAEGLDGQQAAGLANRLQELPMVESVAVGWCGAG